MVGLLSGYLPRLRNSPRRKWDDSRVSLSCVFSIDFFRDEFNIIVEAEDAGDEQEGLGNIDQQTVGHVVNHAQGGQSLCAHGCGIPAFNTSRSVYLSHW